MSQGMSSAVKAKLTTKVMTNWMILTTSMGFQALRKEGVPKSFEAREKLRRLRIPPFANGRRLARQMRQPTVSAAKAKQRYKKRSNCKHKKSGCVCFIVAQLRASALRNGTSETTRPCAHRQIRQQSYESTQEPARSIATKTETFFSIELSSGQNAGERNKTTRSSQQTRELFSIFSPTPLVAASSNSFAPHCGSHSRPRACTRIQPFCDYNLHRSPPTPIPFRM